MADPLNHTKLSFVHNAEKQSSGSAFLMRLISQQKLGKLLYFSNLRFGDLLHELIPLQLESIFCCIEFILFNFCFKWYQLKTVTATQPFDWNHFGL